MQTLVKMEGITKEFPGVKALDNISLEINAGEVHVLLGENGAGKTTLMNILYGLYQQEAGDIYINGSIEEFSSPIKAISLGIGMVHQHFMLARPMTVVENVMLGKKSRRGILLDTKETATELKELADADVRAAQTKLMDILSNYQGYKKMNLILVFDAYRVEGGQGSVQKYHNIYVVYTKEAETADQYIEKTTHEIGRKYKVTVATSDALEQVIVMGQGAYRISARDFYEEVERTEKQIREINERERGEKRNYLLDYAKEEDAREMEKVRLGKTTEK